ncbi:hypothetical protein E2C01_027704 [Portunus trituberculatus]|uniref:Uncharacterized protein n=1 Tax=Portunus trituberculatus TaxID=210409 RepID=A0A5B7EIJ8_PORTR|nr:hypothetical protein [Portunus trituberculatus]
MVVRETCRPPILADAALPLEPRPFVPPTAGDPPLQKLSLPFHREVPPLPWRFGSPCRGDIPLPSQRQLSPPQRLARIRPRPRVTRAPPRLLLRVLLLLLLLLLLLHHLPPVADLYK